MAASRGLSRRKATETAFERRLRERRLAGRTSTETPKKGFLQRLRTFFSSARVAA